MRKSILLLVMLLPGVFCMASCGDFGKKPEIGLVQPDSAVYAMLGKTMSEVLFNPGSVTCYTLKGKVEVDPSEFQVEPHWVRDSLIGKLSPETYGILQFVLVSNNENYKNDTLCIKAPYIPVLEFEFKQKKNVVHVLISTSDRTWTIMYDEKRQIHFNYHDCDVIERFCRMVLESDKLNNKHKEGLI